MYARVLRPLQDHTPVETDLGYRRLKHSKHRRLVMPAD